MLLVQANIGADMMQSFCNDGMRVCRCSDVRGWCSTCGRLMMELRLAWQMCPVAAASCILANRRAFTRAKVAAR